MNNFRVIVISSVRPEPTTAGHIVLHRHLYGQPEISYEVYGEEPKKFHCRILDRRLIGKIGKYLSPRIAEDYFIIRKGTWLDGYLPKEVCNKNNTVVLTVAHGDACWAAKRFAHRHKLPLVTLFCDWWPDMVNAHNIFIKILDKRFKELYKSSAVAFCVSEGMRKYLGPHNMAPIIYNIPQKPQQSLSKCVKKKDFRILYFGNLVDYGIMIKDLLNMTENHSLIRIEVRGGSPKWPNEFKERMREKALWLDYAPRYELDQWLSTGDAFLGVMSFEHKMRRRMETSFLTKLCEYVHFGKPIVIWGPDYCSAVQWARKDNSALCVTDPDSAALLAALETLAASPSKQLYYSEKAIEASKNEFCPERLQKQFLSALREVCLINKETSQKKAINRGSEIFKT